MSLCVGDRVVCTCIPHGHLHTVTHTKCRIDSIDSPDDEHLFARNMWIIGINKYTKRIVRQVGHLQRLETIVICYEDEKKSINKICV